jgi:hypothetical protein
VVDPLIVAMPRADKSAGRSTQPPFGGEVEHRDVGLRQRQRPDRHGRERQMTDWPPHPDEGPSSGAPYTPPRQRSVASLFMVTVMVVTVVTGAVAVVYLLTGGRDRGTRTVQAAVPSVAPSAAPGASGTVDGCVVGEWQASSMELGSPPRAGRTSTDAGSRRHRLDDLR